MSLERHREESNAIQTNLGAIFVSLELSRSTLADHIAVPGRRSEDVETRDAWRQCRRAPGALCATSGESADEDRGVFPFVVIQEAGLDGFWIHRVLQAEGIESHVVDPASIATSRRRRRAKTDKIDFATRLNQIEAHQAQRHAREAYNQACESVGQMERQYTEEVPDYPDRLRFLVSERDKELRALGVTDQGHRNLQICEETRQLCMAAGQRGINPARMVDDLAVARGYTPSPRAMSEGGRCVWAASRPSATFRG
jgi:hypothetical protein